MASRSALVAGRHVERPSGFGAAGSSPSGVETRSVLWTPGGSPNNVQRFDAGRGSPGVRIAVLDGRVDLEHPCFRGAHLALLPSMLPADQESLGPMAAHGTHITSVIFGQPGSEVEGLASGCSGLIIPVFFEDRRSASQLDLGRAIELAVDHGAHIINISGGQLTDVGEADTWLENAVRLCADRNVLVVAAAGNDGCECLHVPAALPMVLPVGALDRQGRPINFSNWSGAYRSKGLMAPGQDILGAKPGGGVTRRSGTSFAAPIAASAAALLLSHQVDRGSQPDPHFIRQLLLDSALPCDGLGSDESDRCLAGRLNLPGAFELLKRSIGQMTRTTMTVNTAISPQCACNELEEPNTVAQAEVAEPNAADLRLESSQGAIQSLAAMALGSSRLPDEGAGARPAAARAAPGMALSSVVPSSIPDMDEPAGLVYALGVLGYDFGTEARRDSFKQLMPDYNQVPANPYDARQMVEYLKTNLAEAKSLIWTLNIELTPVYAIEPVGAFARDVYEVLLTMLAGEIRMESDANFVQRVAIPGVLTKRTVKLFSGQIVPVIQPVNTRGMYGWKTNALIDNALNALASDGVESDQAESIRSSLEAFLNRVYYDLRNLGKTSRDRALNFAVTDAFQVATTFSDSLVAGMQLDEIAVDKSPFCRMDSDCWDVKLKFFDPENNKRAKRIFRYTVDVSDLIPVTMGEVRWWTQPN
ncbi:MULTISPECIES: PatA/PatG family cyanobactin maturation protease [unclassified Bradyrhizobium]|nr:MULTISPECIES: PatA/PatG family cyanobactin maturation protease [unclassified Bradyrhizobium]MDD1534725.1 peptidase S8 [Bradyrhizobium sp. WBOS8]MDD1584216.1 peptidase S8 [Bradyrhizobium sp. WBOS4]UUO50527.1 peptidase S8 [Bradyrhizobium sp. WBOS04]UUO57905.1 peptidase S8 [Bradyrhizobium sp. WBOS08]